MTLSVFSFILINTYSRKGMEEINQTSESMISQSYYASDILLTSIYYNFYQLFSNNQDSSISDALYARKLELYDISLVQSKLNQLLMSNPLLHSLYIYNLKADAVVYRTKTYEGCQSIDDFYDKNIISLLRKPEQEKINAFFARKLQYNLDQRDFSDNYITLVLAYTSSDKEIESALVINLDQEILQQMVTSGRTGDLIRVFIINQEGRIISHPDTFMINRSLDRESYIRRILQSREKTGHFTSTVNNKRSLVTYVVSDRFQWIFVGVGEYSKLLSSVSSMQRTIIILTVVFISAGLVVAALFASSIYNPFHRLLQDIQKRIKTSGKNSSLDVYDYLKYAFHEMADNIDELKLNVDMLSKTRKKELLQKILQGEALYSIPLQRELEEYQIRLNAPFYLVVAMKIDGFSESNENQHWEKDMELLRFSILNIASELAGADYALESVENGNDSVCLIINLKSNEEHQMDAVHQVVGEIQENVERYLKCTVTAGIGVIAEGFDSIGYSHKTALTAAGYRLVFGENSIIRYSRIENRNANSSEYPYNLEKAVIDSIRQANARKLGSSLEEFFGVLGRYGLDEIMMAVTQLVMITSKTIGGLLGDTMEYDSFSFKAIHARIFAFNTLKDMKEYLNGISLNALEIMSGSPHKNKRIRIVDTVRDYVREHYQDPNLTVEGIADYLQLSRNYVRTIFKEMTEVSLSDYITDFRLAKAREMLQGTDHTVKRIAELSGYSDKKYFYVLFKKHSGKTPEDFRMEFRNKAGSSS